MEDKITDRLQIDVRLLLCIPSQETWENYYFFKPKDAETELLEILSENIELIPSEDQQSQHLCTS